MAIEISEWVFWSVVLGNTLIIASLAYSTTYWYGMYHRLEEEHEDLRIKYKMATRLDERTFQLMVLNEALGQLSDAFLPGDGDGDEESG